MQRQSRHIFLSRSRSLSVSGSVGRVDMPPLVRRRFARERGEWRVGLSRERNVAVMPCEGGGLRNCVCVCATMFPTKEGSKYHSGKTAEKAGRLARDRVGVPHAFEPSERVKRLGSR